MPPRKRAAPRVSKAERDCKFHCCTTPPEALEKIRADIGVWEAGAQADAVGYGPACRCGLRRNPTSIGFGRDDGSCPRHPGKTPKDN